MGDRLPGVGSLGKLDTLPWRQPGVGSLGKHFQKSTGLIAVDEMER